MTRLEEIEQKLNELLKTITKEEMIKALEESGFEVIDKESKKEGKWKPEYNRVYWYRKTGGEICSGCYTNNYDEWRINNIPVFPTEEQCQRYWHFMDTVKEKSYSFSEEEWEDDEVDKLVIYYDYTRKEFGVTCTWVCKYLGEIYFKTEEDAKYIIDNFKGELIEFWL